MLIGRLIMKIQKVKSKKNLVLIAAATVVTITVIAAYAFYASNPSSNSSQGTANLDDATDEQRQAGLDTKEQSIQSNGAKPNSSGSDPLPEPSILPDNTKQVDVTITAANQNGNVLQVRSLISALTSTGTCTLTITQGESKVKKESGVQSLANSTTCSGFDIPVAELQKGDALLQLNFSGDNISGSTSRTVKII